MVTVLNVIIKPGMFIHQWNVRIEDTPRMFYVGILFVQLIPLFRKRLEFGSWICHLRQYCFDFERSHPLALDTRLRPIWYSHCVLLDRSDHTLAQRYVLHGMYFR
jgi:hypothetical protein